MEEKNFKKLDDFIGKSTFKILDWKDLDLHHKTVAKVHVDKCIGCDLCYVACWDAAHQCIEMVSIGGNGGNRGRMGRNGGNASGRVAKIIEKDCVGCNLCNLVCPVDGCIEMVDVPSGLKPLTWDEYVKNGMKGYKPIYKRRHPMA